MPVNRTARSPVSVLRPNSRRLPTVMARLGMAMLLLLSADNLIAESYEPMFSEELLATFDPETRERFAELERENRRRWRNRNPRARDVAAAQRQHEATEAMLRRFEESRRLEAQAKARAPELSLSQQKKCKAVAAEIKELSSGGVFYETTADGERRYLSDNEISERVKSQQKSYNKYCKG